MSRSLCLTLELLFNFASLGRGGGQVVSVLALLQLSSLNPVTVYICQLYLKDKNREKEAGNGPFVKHLLKPNGCLFVLSSLKLENSFYKIIKY